MTIQTKLVRGGVWAEAAKQVAVGDIATGLTTSATTQATATLLPADINVFSTVASSGAAVLSGVDGASDVVVYNGGANALVVFCPVGGTMNNTSNGSASVPTSKSARFVSADGVAWYAQISA
jgi:hypothetical protein